MAKGKGTTDKSEYREISYIEEDMREGLLFKGWTQTWGLKVSPWYEMDKVKFAFIEKGASGKGKSFTVCVNTIKNFAFDFETMKHEVLHDIKTPYDFLKVLESEKAAGEKYPKRYRFVTGSNGEKSVGICNSSRGGFCINGTAIVNGEKVFANIPCTFYDIYNIMQAYDETYGARREELRKLREKGIKDMAETIKAHTQQVEADPDEAVQDEPAPETVTTEAPAEAKAEAKAEVKAEEQAQEPAPEQKEAPKPAGLHVRTVSNIAATQAGDYVFEAAKDDDTIISVRVPKDVADELNKKHGMFNKFMDKAADTGTEFTFTGSKKKTASGIEYVFAAFC